MVQPEPMAEHSRAGSQDVTGAVDRLSALPDGLVHSVLSFLPAPEVVRTCVLSRRWRSLWRSVPCINLDERDFGISLMTSHGDDDLVEKWARFEDFAANLLLFHDNTSSLGEFRLSSRVCNQRHVDRWVRRGIEYCPSVLEILILRCTRFKLPPVVGSNFCRLKTLRLYTVDCGSHFAGLLCSSSCPVMEDLELWNCEFSGSSSQHITSRTLKKLALETCENNTGYPLVITAPSLAYLCLTYGCYQAGISFCQMDSIVRAQIHVTQDDLSQQTQRELLCSLYNVTSLELLGFGVQEMLNQEPSKFPIFHNMRTLDLRSCFLDEYELYDKLEALWSFLLNAPCLEKLILRYCMFSVFADSDSEIERGNVTLHRQDGKTFRCPKLKLVEVIYDHNRGHQLIEIVWSLARSLPDASIKLNKIERCST